MTNEAEQERIPLCPGLSFSSDHQADLLSALQQDKLDLFQRTLEKDDVDVNHIYKSPVFTSCVHLAAKSDRREFLELLLKYGANPNLFSPLKKNTPLMCAVEDLNLESVTLLLEHDAQTNIKDNRGRTALHILVVHSSRSPESAEKALAIGVKLLERSDCDINARDNAKYTPLRIAVESELYSLARLLVSNGAETDLPCRGAEELTIADVLRSKGIEEDPSLKVNSENHRNFANLLYEALLEENLDKFNNVLKDDRLKTDDLNVLHGPYTCLTYACLNNLEEYVTSLLAAGADPTVCDPHNKITPIHYAALNGNLNIFQQLLFAAPSSVNCEDINKHTVLHKLALGSNSSAYKNGGHEACLRFLNSELADHKIDVNHQDKIGCTALHYAVHVGTRSVTKHLLNMGANIGVKNVFGDPPVKDMPVEVLSEFLDECVMTNGKDIFDRDLKIEFDYRFLAPKTPYTNENGGAYLAETDSLWYLSKSKLQFHLLKHPVIASFIMLKWQKIKMLVFVNLFFYILFTAILFSHIFVNVLSQFDSESPANSTEKPSDVYFVGFNTKLVRIRSLYVLTVIAALIFLLREVFQFLLAPRRYIFTIENFLELTLICMTFVILFFNLSENHCIALCSFVILLTLAELFLLMGRLPKFSIYVKMFTTVMFRFISFLLWYSILIAAFAASLHVLFRQNEAFDSFGSSLIKTLVMAIGELDYGAFPIAGAFPIGRVIFVSFLFLISLVLMNLLNGLAVSDTGEIQVKARIYSLIGFVEVICYLESMMLGDPFQLLSSYPPFKWLRIVPNCYPFRHILNSGTFSRVRYYLVGKTLLFPRILPHKLIGFFPNINNGMMDTSTSNEVFVMDDEIMLDTRNILLGRRHRPVDLMERLTVVENKIDSLIKLFEDHLKVSSDGH